MGYVEAAITIISLLSGIIGLFKARKHKRKSKLMKKIATSMILGIEHFDSANVIRDPKILKMIVAGYSDASGVNAELNDLVQSITNHVK